MARKSQDDKQQLRIVHNKETGRSGNRTPTLSKVRVQQKSRKTSRPSLLMFTLMVIYKNLYILGVTLTRHKRRYVRRTRLFLSRIRGSAYALLERVLRFSGRIFSNTVQRLKRPFVHIANTYRERKPAIRKKREAGKFPFSEYFDILEVVFRLIARIIATIINYTVPVVAAVFLITYVQDYLDRPMGLSVAYNGQVIGYIRNEQEYDAAIQDVRSRLTDADSAGSYFKTTPEFELIEIEESRLTETGVLADRIIQASGSEVEFAYGLYISDRFYGAVTDKDYIWDKLEEIKDRSRTNKQDEEIVFEKSISLEDGLYPVTSLREKEPLGELLESYETVDQVYTVVEGDTVTGIVDKTGVPYSLLMDLNPDLSTDLQIGQELLTAVARPFMSVQSIYTEVYEEEVPFKVVENENAMYDKGERMVTQEGVNGEQIVTARITAVDGIEVDRDIIATEVTTKPVDELVTVGIRNPQNIVSQVPSTPGTPSTPGSSEEPAPIVTSSGFIRPVSSGYVSVGLGGYPGHTGVDIAGPAGSPIYASAAGKVTVARWTYTGYGIYCVIDHGNGFTTLYAHMSDMYVGVGQTVSQGQVIGARGRTGNTTGNHLHFEVRYGGSIRNPLQYIPG